MHLMTSTLALPHSFHVKLEAFQGNLPELATALRTEQILPSNVPLLQLTREVLAWAETIATASTIKTSDSKNAYFSFADAHPDLLPALANVIALKARLLLPKSLEEEFVEEPETDSLTEWIESVEALAELDHLVAFLAARRKERQGLIPAHPAPLQFPRKERPKQPQRSLAKLLKVAKHIVREVDTPLLAKERLTLADALRSLYQFGQQLSHFIFCSIAPSFWADHTTYFAALLEGIKEGRFAVQQKEIYGKIEVYTIQNTIDDSGSYKSEKDV